MILKTFLLLYATVQIKKKNKNGPWDLQDRQKTTALILWSKCILMYLMFCILYYGANATKINSYRVGRKE